MLNHAFTQHVATPVIPPPTLPRSTQGVFIETRPVLIASPGISFFDISTYRPQCPIQLI